jgi:catechol 2,3-dioxygenase-like lactoylglutathione lyase family enzyme
MPRVMGLGHVGIYVRDLERMVAFYRDLLGMDVTKQNWRAGVVFLSANPESVDHEIALVRGGPVSDHAKVIQQISMRVPTLNDLRVFRRRLVAEGYRIEGVVNHASPIGCYFFDPEGNRTVPSTHVGIEVVAQRPLAAATSQAERSSRPSRVPPHGRCAPTSVAREDQRLLRRGIAHGSQTRAPASDPAAARSRRGARRARVARWCAGMRRAGRSCGFFSVFAR